MANTEQYLESSSYLSSLAVYRGGRVTGKVRQVIGLVIEASGIRPYIGELCRIKTASGETVDAEVVGFREKSSLLMPLGELRGISPGCAVTPTGGSFSVMVGEQLLGKVLDGLGRLLENGRPALYPEEGKACRVDNSPPNPLERAPISEVLPTGVKAIDALLTCGRGQRIGIFSGSGVGKSTLLGMIARHSSADVNVIAMIGERGREVGDFINRTLGAAGLSRSIVVASTSDRPALERVTAALVATTIAEYFRDCGANVILMMDSLTRFCMAQREIGLAVGEPPSARGYTPSVFALLPRLLERSGTSGSGSITGFYTVLVDGDDFTEPITDAVRSILDGHINLSRKLSAHNHFPSLDILASSSRLMPLLVDQEHAQQAAELRKLLATYDSFEDLINIGAYLNGSNKSVDRAIEKKEQIMQFLQQPPDSQHSWPDTRAMLGRVLE